MTFPYVLDVSSLFTYCFSEQTSLIATERAHSTSKTMAACTPLVKEKFERLPETAEPKHYKLHLVPDLQK